jgi:hypothetical protein
MLPEGSTNTTTTPKCKLDAVSWKLLELKLCLAGELLLISLI